MTAVAQKPVGRPWWMTLILGIGAVIIGGLLLFGSMDTRVNALEMVIVLIGLWWLFDGIMNIVDMFIDHRRWGWKLFMGVIGIVAGLYVLTAPRIMVGFQLTQIFILVLGLYGLMEGIILLIMAFQGAGWGAGIMGVFALVLGGLMLGFYGNVGSTIAMLWAMAVWLFIGGFFLIFRGFRDRRA